MKKLLWFCIVITFDFADVFSADAAPMEVSAAKSSSDQPVVLDPFLKAILNLPERITNLVILNDVEDENYLKQPKEDYPFPWRDTIDALSRELLFALTDEQIVLCSKSLWLQIQFLVSMWNDAGEMTYDKFYEQHHQYAVMNDQVQADFEKFQPFIQDLHNMSSDLNGIVRDYHEGEVYDMWKECKNQTKDLGLTEDSEYSRFASIYELDTLYQAVKALQYECKAVGQHYLLFVPKSLIQNFQTNSHLFKPVLSAMEIKGLDPVDLALGLQYSKLKTYNHLTRLLNHQSREIMQETPSVEQSGQQLLASLRACIINRPSIKKEWRDYDVKILPNFNIYLSGHGSSDNIIASISHHDFITMLYFFNKQIRTKNFLFGSCFSGGKSIQDLFQASYLYNNRLLESLTYPIMFLGTTQSSVGAAFDAFDFSLICDGCKDYAEQIWASDNEEYFDKMFSLLSQKPLPNYLEAMKLFSDIIDIYGNVQHSNIRNYVSIKFPHAPWIEPMNYGQVVKKITNLSVAVSSKDIVIAPQVQVILLAANKIDNKIVAHLNKKANNLIFLPVNYHNSHYQLASLVVLNEEKKAEIASLPIHEQSKEVRTVLDELFVRLNSDALNENISIVIHKAEIFGVKVESIFCDVLNKQISFEIERKNKKQSYVFVMYGNNFSEMDLTPELIGQIQDAKRATIQTSGRQFLPAEHYPSQSRTTHRFMRADILDIRATQPPQKEFVESLEQTLSQVPKLVKESQQLQQSWSQDQQDKELYDRRKIDPKKLNIHAKPFVPKGAQPKTKQASVPTENVYTKTFSDKGKVIWVL